MERNIISVLFFGAIADIVGSRDIQCPLTEGESVRDLLTRIASEHPRLARRNLLVAVNEEYVDLETALKTGDEVAIFTAVSGG